MRDESSEMTTSRRLVEGFVPLSLESIDVSSLVQIAARKITVDRVGLADRNIVLEFTMSEKPDGTIRNHGYPWRLMRAEFLGQLFAFQIKLR